MWFVAGWAIFPAVPTDLICYAAGLVRMPYRRMLLGITIGELPLVTAYILLGTKLSGLLQDIAPLGPEVIRQELNVGDYIKRFGAARGIDRVDLVS